MNAQSWIVSCQLFLIYLDYLLTLGFYLSYSVYLAFLITPWLATDILLSFFLFLHSPSIYTLCLLALTILVPASLLTIQLFIRTFSYFRQAKNHSFTVNQRQHKQK